MTDANQSPATSVVETSGRAPKSNVRTALVLALVAAAFYFGMIFAGPLSP